MLLAAIDADTPFRIVVNSVGGIRGHELGLPVAEKGLDIGRVRTIATA